MSKLIVFFIVLFLGVVGVLAFFNQGAVEITVWQDLKYSVPIIALILISAAFGIVSVVIIVAMRDTRRYIDSWKMQRVQKKDKKIRDSFTKGLDAYHAARYEQATELFTQVIADDPTHFDALMRLGDISFASRDVIRARELYLKAQELRPKNIEVLRSLVEVSGSQQKWQESLKYLDEILAIDAENVEILHKKRDIFEAGNQWEDLLEIQQKIIKCKLSEEELKAENQRLIGYKYEIGRHYLESGETDRAIKAFKSLMKSETDFAPAYVGLADAHMKNGSMKDAEDILLKGFEATSSYVFLAKLEKHYISEGEPGTIIDLYQKALQKTPKDTKLQFLLAKLYFRLEMIDYAYDTVNALDVSSFSGPEIHTLMGSIYERRSGCDKAIEEYKKALNIDEAVHVPYCCSHCSHISGEWSGRCPECRNWNTLVLDINEVCKTEKRQNSS